MVAIAVCTFQKLRLICGFVGMATMHHYRYMQINKTHLESLGLHAVTVLLTS